MSPEGRQVTYRYTRPGDVLGIPVLVGGPVNAGVQTVEPSSLFRISSRALTAADRIVILDATRLYAESRAIAEV